MADERTYRETFRYKTGEDRVEQARANLESAAERFHVSLDEFRVITGGGSSRVTVEVTAIGKSADLTRMRENVVGSISVFGDSGGGDISDLVWDLTAGPVLDATATRLRRGWWSVQRRRRGETDVTTDPTGASEG